MGEDQWDQQPGMAMAVMKLETNPPITQLKEGLQAQA